MKKLNSLVLVFLLLFPSFVTPSPVPMVEMEYGLHPDHALWVYTVGEATQLSAQALCNAIIWCPITSHIKATAVAALSAALGPAAAAAAYSTAYSTLYSKCMVQATTEGIKQQVVMEIVGGFMQNEYHLHSLKALSEVPEIDPPEGDPFTPDTSCGIDIRKGSTRASTVTDPESEELLGLKFMYHPASEGAMIIKGAGNLLPGMIGAVWDFNDLVEEEYQVPDVPLAAHLQGRILEEFPLGIGAPITAVYENNVIGTGQIPTTTALMIDWRETRGYTAPISGTHGYNYRVTMADVIPVIGMIRLVGGLLDMLLGVIDTAVTSEDISTTSEAQYDLWGPVQFVPDLLAASPPMDYSYAAGMIGYTGAVLGEEIFNMYMDRKYTLGVPLRWGRRADLFQDGFTRVKIAGKLMEDLFDQKRAVEAAQRLAASGGQLDGVLGEYEQKANELATAQKSFDDLQIERRQLLAQMDLMDKQIGSLSNKLDDLNSDISGLETDIAKRYSRIYNENNIIIGVSSGW